MIGDRVGAGPNYNTVAQLGLGLVRQDFHSAFRVDLCPRHVGNPFSHPPNLFSTLLCFFNPSSFLFNPPPVFLNPPPFFVNPPPFLSDPLPLPFNPPFLFCQPCGRSLRQLH